MTGRTVKSGHALLGTMAFLVLAMLLWLASFAVLSSDLRTATSFVKDDEFDTGPLRAMSWGLTLLETGTPKETPFSCLVDVSKDRSFVITYQQLAANDYTVSVRPATSSDQWLSAAPTTFSTGKK